MVRKLLLMAVHTFHEYKLCKLLWNGVLWHPVQNPHDFFFLLTLDWLINCNFIPFISEVMVNHNGILFAWGVRMCVIAPWATLHRQSWGLLHAAGTVLSLHSTKAVQGSQPRGVCKGNSIHKSKLFQQCHVPTFLPHPFTLGSLSPIISFWWQGFRLGI